MLIFSFYMCPICKTDRSKTVAMDDILLASVFSFYLNDWDRPKHIKWYDCLNENRKTSSIPRFRIKLLDYLYGRRILTLLSFFDDVSSFIHSITFDYNILNKSISYLLTMNWKFFKRNMVQNFFVFIWSSGERSGSWSVIKLECKRDHRGLCCFERL